MGGIRASIIEGLSVKLKKRNMANKSLAQKIAPKNPPKKGEKGGVPRKTKQGLEIPEGWTGKDLSNYKKQLKLF